MLIASKHCYINTIIWFGKVIWSKYINTSSRVEI